MAIHAARTPARCGLGRSCGKGRADAECSKRAGTSSVNAVVREAIMERQVHFRATENGPAFCEFCVCTNKYSAKCRPSQCSSARAESPAPLRDGTQEMAKPCLSTYISCLWSESPAPLRDGTQEMTRPCLSTYISCLWSESPAPVQHRRVLR